MGIDETMLSCINVVEIMLLGCIDDGVGTTLLRCMDAVEFMLLRCMNDVNKTLLGA